MHANKHTASAALIAMSGAVLTALVVAALYVGREVLIPIALAAMLAFLLAPVVTRLERWIGRIAATLVAVAVAFALLGGVGWVLTRQVVELATQLPDYKGNIETKLRLLKMPGEGRFSRLSKTMTDLKQELPGQTATPTAAPGATPTPAAGNVFVAVPQRPVASGLPKPPASAAVPVPVEIVESRHAGLGETLGAVAAPLLGPLGTAALVLVLLVIMLLQREDLRSRVIRLVGKGNISGTTRAMDDAAGRVSRYLLMQLIVNASYGLAIAIGLFFIGVPNSFLWGVLATVLRFIPYVGSWIAAAFPISLSLAVTDGWTMPCLTIGLFVLLELLVVNVMEPLLYGASTGVSSFALVIAAVFWTWLWGAPGLVLATPLTVCLVVMGRHVPRLGALAVLLSDEEALAPDEELYHRLLTPDATGASEFADAYLKAHSLPALYDSVFIPVLASVARDCKSGELEDGQHDAIFQELRDIVQDLGSRPVRPAKPDPAAADAAPSSAAPALTCRVLCLPVRAERDEIAGAMLAHLLARSEFPVVNLSAKLTTGELLERVEEEGAEALCVSVVSPSTVVHARYLCGKLRERFPKIHVIVGLWGAAADALAEAEDKLRDFGADHVVATFGDALAHFSKYAASLAQEVLLLAPPPNEAERLAEIESLQLLDTDAEPAFDCITTKVARILNVPIALITLLDKDREFFKAQTGLPADLALARQTARDVSVCGLVVATSQLLVVEDLARDRRFARHPLLKERGLRFYAGAPLRTAAGHTLGALCVLDTRPRKFTEADQRLLEVMAEEVMEAIQQRSVTLGPARPMPREHQPL